MILRNGLSGLGTSIAISPIMRDKIAGILDRPLQMLTATEFRYGEIYDEMFGVGHVAAVRELVKLDATDPAGAAALRAKLDIESQAKTDAGFAKQRALAAGLPPCPPESITDGGANCYYGRGGAAFTTNDPADPWGLIMPGTVVMYGVPFTPMDYKDGRITRVFKPDAIQRKLLEWNVIRGSLNYLFGNSMGGKALNPIKRMIVGDGHIRDSMRAYIMQKNRVPASYVTQGMLEDIGNTISVDGMLELVPDIRLSLVNFTRNPFDPESWHTSKGGWRDWIQNGGYPLSNDVAHAKVSISEGLVDPELCSSILCQCPGSNGGPACNHITLSKAAGVNDSGGWKPYVAIYQDAANPQWELSLVYKEPAWYKKAAEFLAAYMEKLGMMLCGTLVQTKKQQGQVQQDLCTNKQGAACVRGTPNCTCQYATNASIQSASNANIYAKVAVTAGSAGCAKWLDDNTDPPPMPDPQPLFIPPPPAEGFKLTPTMIAIGVVGLGAVALLARKKKSA